MTMIAIAGQSNALGYLNTDPAPYVVNDWVYIWVKDHWESMRPGVNTGTPGAPTAWGPEVAIANDFMRDHPGEVLAIVKVAQGSTGLASDPSQVDWSPESPGELFDKATAMIRAAGDVIGGQRPVVTYWMQGETDATDPVKAQAYEVNLRDLFSHMRSDWGSDLISMGRIADSMPYFETVRWAQYVVDRDDPHVTSFDTYTFTRQPDGIHYDAAAHLMLGHDMYSGWVLP